MLDIGCNAGFYAMEMKRRGAERVLGTDTDEEYGAGPFRFRSQWTPHRVPQDVRLRRGAASRKIRLVIFMGVLYHLRHPLLALDLIHEHVADDLLLFQSMQRGNSDIEPIEKNYDFWTTDQFDAPGYPKLHFVEHKYADDPTNWWVPNRACVEAMLRSSGFAIGAS